MTRTAPLLPLLVVAALAAAPAAARAGADDDLESPRQSWLIDQTRSQLGGEYFRAFAAAWREAPRGAHMVAVEETGGPFHAHHLTVRVGSRVLLQTRVFASQRDELARLGASGAAQAAQRLAQWQAGSGSEW